MSIVRIDRQNALVEIKPCGFFAPERAQAERVELRAAVGALGRTVGKHVELFDMSEVDVSPPETIAMLQHHFAQPEDLTQRPRKIAFFTPSALARLQLRRVQQARPGIEVFVTRDEALDWLLA